MSTIPWTHGEAHAKVRSLCVLIENVVQARPNRNSSSLALPLHASRLEVEDSVVMGEGSGEGSAEAAAEGLADADVRERWEVGSVEAVVGLAEVEAVAGLVAAVVADARAADLVA